MKMEERENDKAAAARPKGVRTKEWRRGVASERPRAAQNANIYLILELGSFYH